MIESLTSIEKLAYLFHILGKESAGKLIKGLDRTLAAEIDAHAPKSVSKPVAEQILREFNIAARSIADGEQILATDIWDNIKNNGSANVEKAEVQEGFRRLNDMSPENVQEFLSSQSIITKIVVIKNVSPEMGQALFDLMSTEERADYAIESQSANEVTELFTQKISDAICKTLDEKKKDSSSGLDTFLSFTDGMSDEKFEELCNSLPEELAAKVRASTLTFNVIANQENSTLSQIIGDLKSEFIALTLNTLSEQQKSFIVDDLTKNKREEVEFYSKNEKLMADLDKLSEAQRASILKAKELASKSSIVIVR
ncbi:FliG C-terminal domain-containing protein [Vibrio fortis]|uniref:FliG C-terminal domain-containing protein n=1 Tax=Vibrio fortis TaxID=212667 RepID=UPI0040677C5B